MARFVFHKQSQAVFAKRKPAADRPDRRERRSQKRGPEAAVQSDPRPLKHVPGKPGVTTKTILKSSDFGIVFSDLSDKTGN